MSRLTISAILPVLNEAENIQEAIARAWEAGVDQVVIVDGGSSDSTLAIAESNHCEIRQSPPGRGVQMNCGAAHASGAVFLFLHADTWLAPGATDQIRACLAKPTNHWGAFRQAIEHPRLIYRWLEWGNALRIRWSGMPFGDQGIFVTRDAFRRAGGFPPQPLMEDVELSRRLRASGKPRLLEGPLQVSPRRWEARGPLRQTLLNSRLQLLYRCGYSAEALAQIYRRHDQLARPIKPG